MSQASPVEDARTFDASDFRRALGRFPTGVTVITTRAPDGGFIGLTANSFNSVSLDPPLVLWSIGKRQASLPLFQQARVFAVNVLAADQIDLSQRFASPVADRFKGVSTFRAETGAPLLEGCAAWFDCTLHHSYDGGDHLIFVGKVMACRAEAKPALVYTDGQYGLSSRHPMAPPPPILPDRADLPPQAFVDDYLSYLLAKASALVSAQFHAEVKAEGLTVPEWRVLATLSDGTPRTIGALTSIVLSPQPTLTKLVDRMEAKGDVQRETSQEDRRRTMVAITEQGRARIGTLLIAAKQHEASLAGEPGLAGLHALKPVLRDLIGKMVD